MANKMSVDVGHYKCVVLLSDNKTSLQKQNNKSVVDVITNKVGVLPVVHVAYVPQPSNKASVELDPVSKGYIW